MSPSPPRIAPTLPLCCVSAELRGLSFARLGRSWARPASLPPLPGFRFAPRFPRGFAFAFHFSEPPLTRCPIAPRCFSPHFSSSTLSCSCLFRALPASLLSKSRSLGLSVLRDLPLPLAPCRWEAPRPSAGAEKFLARPGTRCLPAFS